MFIHERSLESIPALGVHEDALCEPFNVRTQSAREEPKIIILEPVKMIHGANLLSEDLLCLLNAQTAGGYLTAGLWYVQLVRRECVKETPTSTQLQFREESRHMSRDTYPVSRESRN